MFRRAAPGGEQVELLGGRIEAVVAPELPIRERTAQEVERSLPDRQVEGLDPGAPGHHGRRGDPVVDPEVVLAVAVGGGEVELVVEHRRVERGEPRSGARDDVGDAALVQRLDQVCADKPAGAGDDVVHA